MVSAFYAAELPAAADEVWAVVRNFAAIDTWHPLVHSSTGGSHPALPGDVRIMTMLDGAQVKERLVEISDPQRQMTYIWEDPPPIPVVSSTIRIHVIAVAPSVSRVEIDGHFEAGDPGSAELAAHVSQSEVWPSALRGLGSALNELKIGRIGLDGEPVAE